MRFLRIVDRFCIRVGWRRWAGLALAAPIGIYLIGWSTPIVPYHLEGDALYPWLILSGYLVVLLMGVWLISVACMLRAVWSPQVLQDLGRARTIISSLVVVVSMALCCFSLFVSSATPNHISSIQFGNHTYHLARYSGPGSDWDYAFVVYMVYECDSSGIMCHLYYCPLYHSAYVDYARDLKAFFEIDPAGRLWVQVGPEKTEVKPGCTYGTGYNPHR